MFTASRQSASYRLRFNLFKARLSGDSYNAIGDIHSAVHVSDTRKAHVESGIIWHRTYFAILAF